MKKSPSRVLRIPGTPNAQQRKFFASRARYTAYGGARGGGKSWALRRKLVALCLRYPGIRCLLVRRSYAELRQNHVLPLLAEYPGLIVCREAEKRLVFPNGSGISLGYCSSDRDVLRYQGQEYDIIAIDEATQLTEYQFSIFKACLRGVGSYPRRMYLTCNPGGVGHSWVKRLFVDRVFRPNENPDDYRFIPAKVYDNPVLLSADPDYVRQLESLPPKLREIVGYAVKAVSDKQHRELTPEDVYSIFNGSFVNIFSPLKVLEAHYVQKDGEITAAVTTLMHGEKAVTEGHGNGRLDSVSDALMKLIGAEFSILDYSERALEQGSKSKAMSYLEISINGNISWGVGVHSDIVMSSVYALVSAVNRGM